MSDEIHEDLRAAFEEAAEKTPEDAQHEEVRNDESADPVGDVLQPEKEGKVDAEKPEAAPEKSSAESESPAVEQEGTKLSKEKAPSSWSPKVREKWAALDEDVRAEIIRREEASANGARKLQDEVAPVKQFVESIGGVLAEAQQVGQHPAQYIQNLAQAERNLRIGAPEKKFETLLALADQYGIPLRQAINGAAGKELLPTQQQQMQLPPEVVAELQAARQFREQSQQSSYESQIAAFSSDKEFFNDVAPIMADLMDSGVVKQDDLAGAYERAIWLNPDVRAVLVEREKTGHKQNELKNRQAAAAGASVRSGGSADVPVDDDDDTSIEALVRKSMTAGTGRL